MSWLTIGPDAVEIDVLVVPRASRTQIVGIHEDRLKVQLNAPPVEGEANAALIALLAKTLGIKRSAIQIVSGETGRRKRLRITAVSEAEVRGICPALRQVE